MIVLIKIFRIFYNLSNYLIGPKYCNVSTQDFNIENQFKIRVYGINKLEVKPILIYYHGGGWIAGSIKAYDKILRYICYKSNYVCIAVDYRKAPENKFPILFYDTIVAYSWIIENFHLINGTINKIVICGDSAGGNLIVNLCNFIKKQNILICPKKLVLIYPVIEKNIKFKFGKTYFEKLIFYVSKSIYQFFKNQYFDKDFQNSYEYLSFNILGNKKVMNNYDILLITAKYDALTKGINNFANELSNYSKNVKVIEYPHVIHGFINFMAFSTQARKAIDDIVSYLCLEDKN